MEMETFIVGDEIVISLSNATQQEIEDLHEKIHEWLNSLNIGPATIGPMG